MFAEIAIEYPRDMEEVAADNEFGKELSRKAKHNVMAIPVCDCASGGERRREAYLFEDVGEALTAYPFFVERLAHYGWVLDDEGFSTPDEQRFKLTLKIKQYGYPT